MRHFDVLIVGAGHGGASTATALRQRKFSGTIAIVGEEPDLPYERPPLSKEYLAGEKPLERLLIRPPGFWVDRDVSVLTDCPIVAVDPVTHTVATSGGEKMRYGTLVWATGGHARRLTCAGHDLARVHSVRNRTDVDRMRVELPSTDHVCVVGGGYIGLESAAVLRKLGKQVTVLEAQDRVLARVAGPTLSEFYAAEHRRQGVELHLGTGVDCIEGLRGQATGVRLAGGRLVRCDMVVVGIGIVPAVAPLLEAGAEGGNGVAVDAVCATSLPDVYAVGDCALHNNVYAGGQPIRLESVQNANDQAMTVARAITLDPIPYGVVPWFWSHQYDLKLQTIGLAAGYDTEVVRGSIVARSFSVIYLKAGRVLALDCVNATKDYVQGRALIADGMSPDSAALADSGIALKEARTGVHVP